MKRLSVLLILFLPALAFARWVQVGFLDSVSPRCVVVSNANGSEQYDIRLRFEGDTQTPCWISEPIPLSDEQDRTCRVSWQSGGEHNSREFNLPESSPLQLLLVSAEPSVTKPAQTAQPSFEIGLAPNPFNSQTVLTLILPEAAYARLEVYDVLGRRVTELANHPLTAGSHRWAVDGSLWASGTYFLSYRLSPGPSGVRRLQLLK